jgi:hypothetical protein
LSIQIPCFQFFIHNCLTGYECNLITSAVDEELFSKSRLYSLGALGSCGDGNDCDCGNENENNEVDTTFMSCIC